MSVAAFFKKNIPAESYVIIGFSLVVYAFGTYTGYKKANAIENAVYMPRSRLEIRKKLEGKFGGWFSQ